MPHCASKVVILATGGTIVSSGASATQMTGYSIQGTGYANRRTERTEDTPMTARNRVVREPYATWCGRTPVEIIHGLLPDSGGDVCCWDH